ncbi:MAG: prolipoprotein diacylglyceryl transferase [Clostridia bacterium]|nr:prolipoprotein diacylglyceryl transferase [Clostridia bacterium]
MFSDITVLGMDLYDFFGVLGVFALLIFNYSMIKKKIPLLSKSAKMLIDYFEKKSKFKFLANIYLWTILEIFLISLFQYVPILILNPAFGDFVRTGVNYFGSILFVWFILMIFFFVLSVDPFKQLDLITPAYAIDLFFIKLACFCAGCCRGIECSFGLYNQSSELVEFPVQLVEAGLALLIFIFILLIRNKAKEGTLFPIYLITYSGTRFFSEFLRHEPDVFWRLKTYHILCIIGVVLGIIELIVALFFGDKISRFYDEYGGIKGMSSLFYAIRFRYLKIKKKIMKRDGPIVHHKKRKKKNQKKAKNRK